MERVLLDTGVVIATLLKRDPHHEACRALLTTGTWDALIPALCVPEVAQLLERGAGPVAEAAFVDSLVSAKLHPPLPEDWPRIAELILQYRDFPLGAVDASVIALAERLDVRIIMTLDRRHFATVRPRHIGAFELLP